MSGWFGTTITDWRVGGGRLHRARYGTIEAAGGKLVAVHLRPLPKLLSWPELWPTNRRYHARGEADRCWLYYIQPRRYSNYLALRYVVSTRRASYATFRAALAALDRLAEVKGADALLCDAANSRLSDRLMQRFGWEPHAPSRWRRNYIKRFYGVYPAASASICPVAASQADSVALPLRLQPPG
jgi:hypothetical protein